MKLLTNEENFDEFQKRFYSDSIFQMSRVIFPLESDIVDSSSSASEYPQTPVLNKRNWIMLRNGFFSKNDSIANINGRVYKRKIVSTKSKVVESVYIENSGFRETVTFSLKNGKWYLIDYILLDN